MILQQEVVGAGMRKPQWVKKKIQILTEFNHMQMSNSGYLSIH